MIKVKRHDVMVSKPEHLMDVTELWIRRFAQQNEAYSLVWSDDYNEIEQHMTEFQAIAISGDRKGAIDLIATGSRRKRAKTRKAIFLSAVRPNCSPVFIGTIRKNTRPRCGRKRQELLAASFFGSAKIGRIALRHKKMERMMRIELATQTLATWILGRFLLAKVL